ncbi:hypothetical protein CF326_g7216 [Tilletia indica]|nr:hypothetical protein CF326_g7216 [Tilletia indica]
MAPENIRCFCDSAGCSQPRIKVLQARLLILGQGSDIFKTIRNELRMDTALSTSARLLQLTRTQETIQQDGQERRVSTKRGRQDEQAADGPIIHFDPPSSAGDTFIVEPSVLGFMFPHGTGDDDELLQDELPFLPDLETEDDFRSVQFEPDIDDHNDDDS